VKPTTLSKKRRKERRTKKNGNERRSWKGKSNADVRRLVEGVEMGESSVVQCPISQ
jgi:hypothetical protein